MNVVAVFVCAVLVALAVSVHGLNNGLGLTPPLGWNTWCTDATCGYDVCTEAEVKSVADAMIANGMRDLGYVYVNLDDCWADHRDAAGNLVEDSSRFPSGMKALADYLHDRDMKLGLYTDSGLYTCSSGQRPYKIPGSYGHYEQDAATFASWGVDYVKMDWCNTVVNGTQLDPKNQYPEMSAALNKTGRPIFFEACEWGKEDPWKWMQPVANMWRSGGDHHDDWDSTASIIEHNVGIGSYAAPGGWNYLDFVMTGGQGCASHQSLEHCPGQSDDEYRTEFTMWAIMNSGLIVATDVRNMTAIMTEILLNKEMLAVNQDSLGKAGDRILADRCESIFHLDCQVWAKPLSDGSYCAVLYNSGNKEHDIILPFKSFGWDDKQVTVRDLWQHKDLGVFETYFKGSVNSHGVVALKISVQQAEVHKKIAIQRN